MIKAVVIASAVVVASAGKAKEAAVAAKKGDSSTAKTISLNDGQYLSDVTLTSSCSPPTKLGGQGFCGPEFCELAEKWSCTGSGKCAVCAYEKGTNQMGTTFNKNNKFDYQGRINVVEQRQCRGGQSKDARCTSEFLKSHISGDGVKLAFCNDNFLVMMTDLSAGYPNWISDIPNPPGGGEDHDRTDQSDSGIFCQTGIESMYEEFGVYKFPLKNVMLKTDDYTNNLNYDAYPNGCHRNNPGSHMCEKAGSGQDYGQPVRGPVGITVTGQEIFPVYNNVGYLAPQKCEVDSCHQHIGAGGGQTHIHGDPFGAWCMYDVDNYTSSSHHPPIIGYIFDGFQTYGRYIDTSSLGFDVPLDGCGGHTHDDFGYHYHAAIIESVTDGGRYNPPSPTYDDFIVAGLPYLSTTPGPFACMKADISLIPNYWSGWRGSQKVFSHVMVVPDFSDDLCYGSTEYYLGKGLKIKIHANQAEYDEYRAQLTDEEKELIASKDAYDQWLIEQAAAEGKAIISPEDYMKMTLTYDGDDKLTLEEAMKKAAVPVVATTTELKVEETVAAPVQVEDSKASKKSASTETKSESSARKSATSSKKSSQK